MPFIYQIIFAAAFFAALILVLMGRAAWRNAGAIWLLLCTCRLCATHRVPTPQINDLPLCVVLCSRIFALAVNCSALWFFGKLLMHLGVMLAVLLVRS